MLGIGLGIRHRQSQFAISQHPSLSCNLLDAKTVAIVALAIFDVQRRWQPGGTVPVFDDVVASIGAYVSAPEITMALVCAGKPHRSTCVGLVVERRDIVASVAHAPA